MRTLLQLTIVGALVAASSSLLAQDFKVTTKIYQDENREPVRENHTFFYKGRVFDVVLPARAECTVLDLRTGRMILMDNNRRVKSTIPLYGQDGLMGFTAELKTRADRVKDAFFMNPEFEETFDLESGNLILDSSRMRYDVQTAKPRFVKAAADYKEFADWFARLNSARPGNLPPFARLKLNESLGSRRLLPREVELTLQSGGREVVLRAEHDVYWVLSRNDRKTCEAIGGHISDFTELPLPKFLIDAS